jgi:hypothetical protein
VELSGFTTPTITVAGEVSKLLETVAWRVVDDTNVVERLVPAQLIAVPETKFVPVTVMENAGLPAIAVAGLRLVTVGNTGGGTTVPPDPDPPQPIIRSAETLRLASSMAKRRSWIAVFKSIDVYVLLETAPGNYSAACHPVIICHIDAARHRP